MNQELKAILENEHQDQTAPSDLKKRTLESIHRLDTLKSILELLIVIPVTIVYSVFDNKD